MAGLYPQKYHHALTEQIRKRSSALQGENSFVRQGPLPHEPIKVSTENNLVSSSDSS